MRDGEMDVSGMTPLNSAAHVHTFRASNATADGIHLHGKQGCDFPRFKLAFEGMTQVAGCICVFIEGGIIGEGGELIKDKPTRRFHIYTLPRLQEMGYQRIQTGFDREMITWRLIPA